MADVRAGGERMSDYRKIEVIINVIGLERNPMTGEPPNKIIPIRRRIVVNKNLSIEDMARAFEQAIMEMEDRL